LTVSEKTGTSITLNFPATTTETNFAEYKIFYKAYDGTAPEETDSLWGSSSESDLGDIDFNHQATTTVTGLVSGQRYSFNIFAYDQYGHVASSSGPIDAYANNQPTAYFNSVGQKSDGSGAVDISIEVDDGDNSDVVRAKVEYAAMTAGDCVFASPLDPTLDASAISSDYGAVHIDNDDAYQVGTTSFFIITSPGANTIDFDWLSKVDVGIATGTYCLRVTASDGFDDQVVPATTSLTIDNVKPVAAGNLVIGSVSYNSVRLVLPTASRASDDNEPGTNAYRIFYRLGTSGVTEVDSEHDGAFLDAYDFGGATSTLVSGLSQGSNYAFNIWAYDAYGNKASSTEVTAATDGIVTNKGLSFIDAQSAGTTTLVAVASGTFTFRAQVQDSDGWGALDYVILRLANRNDDSAPFDDLRFKWDRASDAFSEIGADASGMASVMPSSASDCSDAVCYLDFRLAFTKNFAATSTSYSVQLYSSDTDVPAHTDEDTYSNVFQVRKSWLDQIHYRWRNDDGGG
jgi:hypothetical protein